MLWGNTVFRKYDTVLLCVCLFLAGTGWTLLAHIIVYAKIMQMEKSTLKNRLSITLYLDIMFRSTKIRQKRENVHMKVIWINIMNVKYKIPRFHWCPFFCLESGCGRSMVSPCDYSVVDGHFFFQFLLVVLSVRAGGGIYFKSCFRCLKDGVLFCADILPQLPLLWDNAGGSHLFVGGRLSSLGLKNRVFALHTHSWRNV